MTTAAMVISGLWIFLVFGLGFVGYRMDKPWRQHGRPA